MLKSTSAATADYLQRKLTARMKTMKKEAAEFMKIAAQSREGMRELFCSAEKQHEEYTASKDPSDQVCPPLTSHSDLHQKKSRMQLPISQEHWFENSSCPDRAEAARQF